MVGEHFVVGSANFGDGAIACMFAGKLAGMRLERAHYRQRVPHGVHIQRGDTRPTIWQQINQPLAGQHARRLTQWRARYAQKCSEFTFVKPRTRGERALHNHLAQPLGCYGIEHACAARINVSARVNQSDFIILHTKLKPCLRYKCDLTRIAIFNIVYKINADASC